MKIPKSLKVGGRTVPVIRKPSTEMSGEMGFYNDWAGAIWITDDIEIAPQQNDITLLHEIIECLDKKHEYKLPHPVIQGLAENLYQVLKDNGLDFRGK